jgi:hypothetical protein
VGCCDASKNKHARAHFEDTGHASVSPLSGDSWTWCYPDNSYVESDGTLK